MRKTTVLLFSLFHFFSLQLSAQPAAEPMQPGRTADGLVYFLPKTAVRFTLLVEHRAYEPGEFARYAEKYLHLKGISQQPQQNCTLADFSLTTVGLRDTSKCYVVRMKGGKAETADVRLSDDGVLLAINDAPMQPVASQPFRPAPQPPTADPRRYLSADVMGVGSTAKMAELTAQQMLDLQEHRQQLITGEADDQPQDEQQLRLMLGQIDAQYDALLTLFTGTVRRDTTQHTLTLCPRQETAREVIFRISRRMGLVDADDLSGVPYYLSVQNLHPTNYALADNRKHEGLYVNVPATVRLTLSRDEQTVATFDVPMAQFGFVELRDATSFRRLTPHVTLHPATGAVVRWTTDTEK